MGEYLTVTVIVLARHAASMQITEHVAEQYVNTTSVCDDFVHNNEGSMGCIQTS